MEVSARVILKKLELVDPTVTTTNSTYSAYQQSAEIRQLWISVESSITKILTITSSKFSMDPMDASSQIISVLSASTLLSSIIHSIINTQRRLQKSDENIENVIKKEMKVILYHIQILKQGLNQSTIKAESAQEAIIHHTDLLIDSLVAYSLSPSNLHFLIHPYKVSPSTSFIRRHSQPAAIITTQTANNNDNNSMTKKNTLSSHHQYGSSSSLISSNSSSTNSSIKEKTDTVGRKLMRSINSLKSRPAFHMTLLPSRHLVVEPTSTEHNNNNQPPKKKRIFYDHRTTAGTAIISEAEEEEDPDNSDDSTMYDDDSTSNNSFNHTSSFIKTTADAKPPKSNNTLRLIFNGKRHSEATVNSARRSSATTRGIKDLFYPSPAKEVSTTTTTISSPYQKKKRESLSNLFSGNKNNKRQSITKEANNTMQGSIHSSSTTTFTPSSSTERESTAMKSNNKLQTSPSFLISPFARKTGIEWSVEEEESLRLSNEEDEDYNNVSNMIALSFESYSIIESSTTAKEDTYSSELVAIKREKSRKRHSNGSLVAAPSVPPKVLSSTPMTRNNSPLPPLPTVENFLTIMNAPTTPDSSYFSARSTSSSSSTLSSMILDDVTDGLSKTQISATVATNDHCNFNTAEEQEKDTCVTSPPIPPPKDYTRMNNERQLTMDPQDHSLTHMNNKQEKRSSSNSSLKRISSSTEMRISTSDISNHYHSPPKSADIYLPKKRPPIPPRTSSMPLQPPKISATILPPLPADAKKKAYNYSRRASAKTFVDENTPSWSSLLLENTTNKKDELMKRTKLGRSLGASSPTLKKIKKSDSGKLLKVTENGRVVLLFEMMDGKLQAIAGTTEKLFERLADETAQDEEYLDTYLMNHTHFISSIDLLNLLINRFHLEPSPGEYEYFKKWQYSIQTKVLNVVERWITFYYYQDFKYDNDLLKRLKLFLYNDSLLLAPQFKEQLDKIRSCLKSQSIHFSDSNSHLSLLLLSSTAGKNNINTNTNFNFHIPFVNSNYNYVPPFPPVHFSNSPRRPSNGLFSLTSPPESPVNTPTNIYTSFSSLESKDIARYLTLADYYLFKSIQAHGLLNNSSHCKRSNDSNQFDYVELMTKRANMLSHWVVHEVCSITYFKPKRALLKKFIEIAKLCLELNNFHTCMVIIMGLSSAPKLKETWESLSNRDANTFSSLQKLLDVNLNMRYYRQKIQLAKPPSIPFLPVVLKDQTFFKENSTFSISHPDLINFSKFRSIYQFIEKNKSLTNEQYWFSQDLVHFPFFTTANTDELTSKSTKKVYDGQLDSIGDWIENRLSKVQDCYLHCDLLSSL